MRIRVLGGGWYGAHLSTALLNAGHSVELWESGPHLFCGASGKIPARLHAGALHYPRSSATRRACMAHREEFMARYGFLTRGVQTNIYAIASDHSLIDFGTYLDVVKRDLECITIHDPAEYGLTNVEGAILTGERHILSGAARAHFERELAGAVQLNVATSELDNPRFDLTIDCTFAANHGAGVDRYEPCLVLLLRGPTDRAITIMDGPFPSLYPWDPERGLCSLSSAKFTPFSKDARTYAEARSILDSLTYPEVLRRGLLMLQSMREFYPAIEQFEVAEHMLSIRAMPLSGADTRLVDVARVSPRVLRVRAGKIDAVIEAERKVLAMLGELVA